MIKWSDMPKTTWSGIVELATGPFTSETFASKLLGSLLEKLQLLTDSVVVLRHEIAQKAILVRVGAGAIQQPTWWAEQLIWTHCSQRLFTRAHLNRRCEIERSVEDIKARPGKENAQFESCADGKPPSSCSFERALKFGKSRKARRQSELIDNLGDAALPPGPQSETAYQ